MVLNSIFIQYHILIGIHRVHSDSLGSIGRITLITKVQISSCLISLGKLSHAGNGSLVVTIHECISDRHLQGVINVLESIEFRPCFIVVAELICRCVKCQSGDVRCNR